MAARAIPNSELLAKSEFFTGISNENQAALLDISSRRKLRKGQELFHEGARGEAIYLLASGSVQLYKSTPDGREVVIRIVKPGDMFAEVILFEQDEYPVTAAALNDSEVLVLPKKRLLGLLFDESFRNDFIAQLMRKLRYLARRIRYFSTHDAEERLVLFLEDQYGRKAEITPALSKKEMANSIAITPEAFSRLLARLRKSGKLAWTGKVIKVRTDFWRGC